MHKLNHTLLTLYRHLPAHMRSYENPSKIEILTLAIYYIRNLESALTMPQVINFGNDNVA